MLVGHRLGDVIKQTVEVTPEKRDKWPHYEASYVAIAELVKSPLDGTAMVQLCSVELPIKLLRVVRVFSDDLVLTGLDC